MRKQFLVGQFLILFLSLGASCGKAEIPKVETEEKESACQSCKQITSAQELSTLTLNPGDTVILQSGQWIDQALIFKAVGTEKNPIVLMAQERGKVQLKGTSTLSIEGEWLVVDGLVFQNGYAINKNVVDFTGSSNHCRLTHTAIIDYNPPGADTDYRWISIKGSYNRIDHCYLSGKAHLGPTLVVWGTGQPMHHRIDHNYFGMRPAVESNGGETIRIGTSDWSMTSAFTTIEENIFEHCDGETEIISNKMSENIIRNNLFYESKGTLCLRHGNGTAVYGNYFIGNGIKDAGGIRVIGEDHLIYNNYFQNMAGTGQRSAIILMDGVLNSPLNGYFQVKHVRVVGNTLVNCKQSFDIGSGKGGNNRILPPLGCHIANNVILQTTQSIAVKWTDIPIDFIYKGNIAFEVPSSTNLPLGFTKINPLLVLNNQRIYEPAIGSPVFGAAEGDYAFFPLEDAGAERLDEKHRALLQAKGIGPVFMTDLGAHLAIRP